MRSIGVISDTHGLLRPEAIDALAGSDLILHAGDVGGPEILQRLADIAPVHAVRGNTDRGPWAEALPLTAVVELGGEGGPPLAYLLHDIEDLDIDPAAAGMAVVVYGHSHKPRVESRGGVTLLNPGAAGHRRFTLPVTVARIHVGADGRLEPEIVTLL